MRPGRAASALLLFSSLVTAQAAASEPTVRTVVIDRYLFEPRVAGDGAPIVHVADEVPELLFLYLTRARFTVWWRARHTCDKRLRGEARVKGDRLTLAVDSTAVTPTCERQSTVFETVVEGWGNGPREVRSEGASNTLASRWVSSPSPPLPAELTILADRMRERRALRHLGERIAWSYHATAEPGAAISAYRWLVALDELHWRTPLYHARIFHNAAFTKTKAGALAALDALVVGIERLRGLVESEPRHPELAERKRELRALEAFVEPALFYLGLKWHSEALHRWHATLSVYRTYVRLFPDHDNAAALRFFYGSALLHTDDLLAAREQFLLAAAGLSDPEQRELAAACAVVLGLEGRTWAQLAPCRAPKPAPPPFGIFPRVAEETFARPPDLEE